MKSGRSNDRIWDLTRRLSNELGEPESFGRIQEIVHSLVRSREENISERVKFSWVVTGYTLVGSSRGCSSCVLFGEGMGEGLRKGLDET